jgi:hypothetical protein
VRLILPAVAVFVTLVAIATAQKIVSPPPQTSPAPAPLQPPSPSTREEVQSPQDKPGASQQSTATEQRGTEDRPAIVKILPPEKTPDERAQEQKDRADKASADWWFRVLTGALIIVGIMQFLALIGQGIVFAIQARRLRESIGLTRDIADRQEKDTKESIAIARLGMISAQRAYVSTRSMAMVRIPIQGAFESISIQVRLQNTGETPTKNLLYHCSMKIFDGDIPDYFDFPNIDARPVAPLFIAPKGAWMGTFMFNINHNTLITAIGGRRRIFVWGWADCNDVFHDTSRHRTEFCFEIVVSLDPAIGRTEQAVGASQHRRHNATDDECYRRPAPYTQPGYANAT